MKKYLFLFVTMILVLPLSAADDNGSEVDNTDELRIGDLFTIQKGWRIEAISRGSSTYNMVYNMVEENNPDNPRIDALIITGLFKGQNVITEPGTPITFSGNAFVFPESQTGIGGFLKRMMGDRLSTEVLFMTTRLHDAQEPFSRFIYEPNEAVLIPTEEQNDGVEIETEKRYQQPNGSPYIFYKQFRSNSVNDLKRILKNYRKVHEPEAPKTKSAGKQ